MVVERDEKGQWGYPIPRVLRRRLLELAREGARGKTFGEFCAAMKRGGWPLVAPEAGHSDADLRDPRFDGAKRLLAAIRYLRDEGVLRLADDARDLSSLMLSVRDEWVPAIEEAFATYEQPSPDT